MTEPDFNAICAREAERIFKDVLELSKSPGGRRGVTRLGYTPAEDAVMAYLTKEGERLGLEIETDPAGNVWMTLPGRDRSLPALVAGSHTDSVLDGGNYDGLAGICAALAPVWWWKGSGKALQRDYRVLLIRSEEQGLIGTAGILGKLTGKDLARRFVEDGPTLGEALAAHAIDPAPLMGGKPLIDLSRIAAFFEAHIEQRETLDRSPDRRVGIVTGIRGVRVHRRIAAHGVTAHAGAIEYPDRHDAVAACARFISRMFDHWTRARAMGEDLVFTTGGIRTPDTAIFNKISGECEMTLDMRSLDQATFDRFSSLIDRELADIGEEMGVTFEADPPVVIGCNRCDASLIERLHRAADALGIGTLEMPSGAGHDAANFGAAGIPYAMLFIANQHGSHNPDEAMKTEDFVAAAAVMTRALEEFDD